jgi:hypothetical protein
VAAPAAHSLPQLACRLGAERRRRRAARCHAPRTAVRSTQAGWGPMAHPLRLQPAVRHGMMTAFFYFSDFLRAGLGRGGTRRPPPGLALAALSRAGLLHDTCPRGAGRQRAVRFIPADSAYDSSISESPARVPRDEPGGARRGCSPSASAAGPPTPCGFRSSVACIGNPQSSGRTATMAAAPSLQA